MLVSLLSSKGGLVGKRPPPLSQVTPTKIFAMDIETHGADGTVGECPANGVHGICGLSICNMRGQAFYTQVNDVRDYGAIPVGELIKYLNENWCVEGAIVIFHNAKFDLGFLINRGLNLKGVKVRDSWAVSSINCKGVFTSNRLKDLVKVRFGIDTDSEEVLKKWMEEHKTEDYGDIPLDIIGPYGADDSRYTLALALTQPTDDRVNEHHDLLTRNSLHLNRAEAYGVSVDLDKMRSGVEYNKKGFLTAKSGVKHYLGASVFPKDDPEDQQLMRILHNKNLHPGPREYFGETVFIPDFEFLLATRNDTALSFCAYAKHKRFLNTFSGEHGQMKGRIWKEGDVVGFYPSFLCSLFSQGGMALCKRPNFADGQPLTDDVRKFFIPRPCHSFVTLKAKDLTTQLLAYYTRNEALEAARGKDANAICEYVAGLVKGSAPVGSLLLRKIFEGSGIKLLEQRFKILAIRCADSYKLVNTFESNLTGFGDMMSNLRKSLVNGQSITDACGREIRVPKEKDWRRHAILVRSSFGSICAKYLDLFCRLADQCGARLVMVNRDEFLFEAQDVTPFKNGVVALLERKLVEPHPEWVMESYMGPWRGGYINAEDVIVQKWE